MDDIYVVDHISEEILKEKLSDKLSVVKYKGLDYEEYDWRKFFDWSDDTVIAFLLVEENELYEEAASFRIYEARINARRRDIEELYSSVDSGFFEEGKLIVCNYKQYKEEYGKYEDLDMYFEGHYDFCSFNGGAHCEYTTFWRE